MRKSLKINKQAATTAEKDASVIVPNLMNFVGKDLPRISFYHTLKCHQLLFFKNREEFSKLTAFNSRSIKQDMISLDGKSEAMAHFSTLLEFTCTSVWLQRLSKLDANAANYEHEKSCPILIENFDCSRHVTSDIASDISLWCTVGDDMKVHLYSQGLRYSVFLSIVVIFIL
jgi:hypothetical protein